MRADVGTVGRCGEWLPKPVQVSRPLRSGVVCGRPTAPGVAKCAKHDGGLIADAVDA